MRPGIGTMRTRLALQAPVDAPDDTGGAARAWTTIAHVWGRVVPQRGEERFVADALETAVTHVVTIRARADVGGAMRFLLGPRALLIRSAFDPDGRGRILQCRCEEFAP